MGSLGLGLGVVLVQLQANIKNKKKDKKHIQMWEFPKLGDPNTVP